MLSPTDTRFDDARSAVEIILRGDLNADLLENEQLDFKEESNRRDSSGRPVKGSARNQEAANRLAQAACCFANHIGGVIVVGVDDATSGPEAFIGTELAVDWLVETIGKGTKPRVEVGIAEFVVDAGEPTRLLLIDVPRHTKVVESAGKCFQRSGASCRELDSYEKLSFTEQRENDDWSGELSSLPVEAANPDAIAAICGLLAESGDEPKRSLASRNQHELCRRLRLATDGTLNNAGQILLVGREELFDCRARSVPGKASSVSTQIGGPLVLALQEATDFVSSQIETQDTYVGMRRIKTPAIPERTCREALVNAAMHRNYRVDTPTKVEVVTRRTLSVLSPGGFPWGIGPDNILTAGPESRNRTLADALRYLGIAESEGIGVDTMYREMIFRGSRPPEFSSSSDNQVKVFLAGGAPNQEMVKFSAGLSLNARDDVELAIIISQLLRQSTISADELAPHLKKGSVEAAEALERAQDEDIVELATKTRSDNPRYRLKEEAGESLFNLTMYQPGPRGGGESEIIAYMRGHQEIRTRNAAEILRVAPETASRTLSRLRRDGLIQYGNEQTRGRGVFYIPGPDFPAE